tara:strand:+ start:202 stop:498 length:297 start_codon:yes stop_codon:yes gene_type:complete
MSKYAIYTKWLWKNGLASSDEIQEVMKENLLGKTEAEDIIWWKMDNNHHQSIIIFPSEEIAKAENDKRQEMRKKTSSDGNITMVDEYMGPVLAQLSNL